jgi:crotonobetainyl-CoA:carnitine CoA-transferase CaiB-like acyl-CoA transferase
MSQRPMSGVQVLEVAQFTFVPAAGAILADWGADVIKVEHAIAGDAQRGFIDRTGWRDGSFHPIMEHPNRGKRSIGLSLDHPDAVAVFHDLVRSSDVLLTNFLPDARERLKIDVGDIRAINPDIIYVRGSAFGSRGPDARSGGYDAGAFWSRSASAAGSTPAGSATFIGMPAPAFGDSIGGMTIAGGIAAALFARATTGTTSTIDVSLLSVGAWANALAIDLALAQGTPWPGGWMSDISATNPMGGAYPTSDGRFVYLSVTQPGRYWKDFCGVIGREDLASDDRWNTVDKLMANAPEATAILRHEFQSRTLAEWRERLAAFEGTWAVVQNSLEFGNDPQLRANGGVAEIVDADGVKRELVASPVRFDDADTVLTRGPQFAEHTDEILRSLGRNDDEILELKLTGSVT